VIRVGGFETRPQPRSARLPGTAAGATARPATAFFASPLGSDSHTERVAMSGRREKERRRAEAAAVRVAGGGHAAAAIRTAPVPPRHRPAPPADRRWFAPLPAVPALERVAAQPWMLPAVLAAGLALRLIHLAFLRQAPFFSLLVLDARAYDEWAQQIAAGTWIGHAAFWVDPLYAYVLGILYAIGGRDLLIARLVNIAFGLGTAAVIWQTALRVWGSRTAAAIAAVLFLGFVPAILFEGQIEKTALTVLLLSAAAYLFLVGTPRAIAAAGAVAGLAALARGNALAFVPLGAAVLALGWDRERGDALTATRRARLVRAGVFLATAVPVVALATLHNYAATGELVPTTTNLGINLYLGNHTGNLYGYYDAPEFLHPSTETEIPDFRAEARRRTGRTFTDNELSRYWAGEAWAQVKADPDLAIARSVRKVRLALHNDEIPDSEGVALVGLWSPIMHLPIFWFGQLVPLAVLGAIVGWRRRGVRVMAGVAVIYLLTLVPFFLMARLRVQLVAPCAVLGGGAVAWLAAAAVERKGRAIAAAAAVLAASALVVFYRPDWMAQRRLSSLAIQWYNLGASLQELGRTDEAVQAWEHAVATNDKAVPAALRALGAQYEARGEFARAEAAMRRVLELKPNSPSAREALATLYDRMLQDPRWRDDARIRRERQALGGTAPATAPATAAASVDPVAAAIAKARAAQQAGRTEDAIAALQDAVRTGPYDEGLHYMLGSTMERHASPDAMIAFFSQDLAHDEKPQTSQYFWAIGLARKGDLDGAIAHLREALAIDPAHEMSQWQWGLLLERQNRLDESLQHLDEATRIHPEFKAALEDAARVADKLGRTADAEEYRRRAAAANPNADRRFVYWARYLHAHGRDEAAWAEVHRMLLLHPDDAEALALRDEIRTALGDHVPPIPTPERGVQPARAGGAWALSPDARSRLVQRLSSQPRGTPAWIVYDARDGAAQRAAKQLADAFEEAGWTVRGLDPAPMAMRPGIFLFAADDPPSASAAAVAAALDGAQLKATVGTGYRAFGEQRRRADPNWRGIEFTPEQSFVLAIGRAP
jgi:tetratricopeptide (TPR) repeat protein